MLANVPAEAVAPAGPAAGGLPSVACAALCVSRLDAAADVTVYSALAPVAMLGIVVDDVAGLDCAAVSDLLLDAFVYLSAMGACLESSAGLSKRRICTLLGKHFGSHGGWPHLRALALAATAPTALHPRARRRLPSAILYIAQNAVSMALD